MNIEVTDQATTKRYEITADGEPAGFVEYQRQDDGPVALNHTEIDGAFSGQGLGGTLISFALDDARTRGLRVRPFCPFVRSYIDKHREYLDLIPTDERERFEL